MKFIFIFILFIIIFSAAIGQNITGQKVFGINMLDITSGFGNSHVESNGINSQMSSGYTISLTPRLYFGKINNGNWLISYGVQIPTRFNHNNSNTSAVISDETMIGLFPSINFQKLSQLGKNIYFGPSFGFVAGYNWHTSSATGIVTQHDNTFELKANFIPLTITWFFKPKICLMAGLGNYYLDYSKLTTTKEGFSQYKAYSNNITLNGNLNSLSVGFQFLLSK